MDERERLAEAWDEGFEAGDRHARAVNPEWPQLPSNPYRSREHDPRCLSVSTENEDLRQFCDCKTWRAIDRAKRLQEFVRRHGEKS